ncbi:MAG: molecular chaperone HtpG [Ruminococcaceae bacterium]|nr:molecular chaperone HtpG [Oscillospiraceae bacterium]
MRKGGITVETEHIFPIIKRWLYSDKEIFLRELVSNACDAVTKMKRLVSLNEASFDGSYRIDVKVNEEEKTLTVSDNGLGMSEEEIDRYINQIALSGALEFIQKYEGENEDSGIIGHFGLGFYSAFMVADRVEIVSKSFTDAPAVRWSCNELGEYEMNEADKAERGTDIILHVTDEEADFLKKETLTRILDKYCAFMPIEIYLNGEEKPINDTTPLWLKNPSDCTPEEYSEFYKKLFADWQEPLFYIHINADYPLNFKGILYFPKPSHEFSNMEGQVKLYYNQVFVADNIKEVIPEYLMTLRGVLDCPELPLNVSRSYLQNSGYVSKISAHIVKKVADKINSLFNTEREKYEGIWDDLKPFVEYGCMRDKKFLDKVKGSVIYKNVDDKYVTLSEYTEKNTKEAGKVFYATDKTQQSRYIALLKEEEIDVLLLDSIIDSQFITHLEQENADVKFVRCDSDIAAALKSEGETVENEVLKELFVEAIGKEKTEVEFASLKNEKTPAMITLSEQERRFSDMMKLYSRGENMPGMDNMGEKLIVNTKNALIEKISTMLSDPAKKETAKLLAKQVYMLALVSQRTLTADELEAFVNNNVDILSNI